jgi:hypothetical protein
MAFINELSNGEGPLVLGVVSEHGKMMNHYNNELSVSAIY